MLFGPWRACLTTHTPVALVQHTTRAMAPKRKAPAEQATDQPAAEVTPQGSTKKPAKRAPARAKEPAGPAWEPSMRPPPLPEGTPAVRLLSWNVAGLRALCRKVKEVEAGTRKENVMSIAALAKAERADIVCLQELKLGKEHLPEVLKELNLPEDWQAAWNPSRDKKGYSGTAILSRHPPLSVTYGIGRAQHDGEGRVVTAEFAKFFVCCVYVPNAGEGLKRLDYRVQQWDKDFAAYLTRLQQLKPVVVAGDLNVAATEIDIHSPKTNLKSAGFTPEERASFKANLLDGGFVDGFRATYPTAVAYSYWGYRFNARANNKGWRLDYFLVSQQLQTHVHDCFHMPNVMGSDHCPLGLVLKL